MIVVWHVRSSDVATLTSEKLNNLIYIQQRSEVTGQNFYPPNWKDRQMKTNHHNLWQQNPKCENLLGNQSWGRKTATATEKWPEAQCVQM